MTKYYGFNFQWMYNPQSQKKIQCDERALDFMCEMSCNFVRLPLNYWFWIRNFEYDNCDETVLSTIDEFLHAIISRGLHCSLNLHRAPGYCINGAELEKHNLWTDEAAQTAFINLWKKFSKRYSYYTGAQLSFDLLNEPPNIGQYGCTRDVHEKLVRQTVQAIRDISPNRPITIDGLGGGNIAMPELADLGLTMSTRGYQPMAVTHYKASWCAETKDISHPLYPGTLYDGKTWTIDTLREHYKPWVSLSNMGVPVHVGEFGCYDSIDNETALSWFKDLFQVFSELGWGYALWEFEGSFGIIGHNRPHTRWEKIGSYTVDRDLYELFKNGIQG